jgi:hypothetical protein
VACSALRQRHPLDLLKAEQERISRETHHTQQQLDDINSDLDDWHQTLTLAVKFAANCHRLPRRQRNRQETAQPRDLRPHHTPRRPHRPMGVPRAIRRALQSDSV